MHLGTRVAHNLLHLRVLPLEHRCWEGSAVDETPERAAGPLARIGELDELAVGQTQTKGRRRFEAGARLEPNLHFLGGACSVFGDDSRMDAISSQGLAHLSLHHVLCALISRLASHLIGELSLTLQVDSSL